MLVANPKADEALLEEIYHDMDENGDEMIQKEEFIDQ